MMLVQNNVPLAGKTTFRIGGAAHYYVAPCQPHDVFQALTWAKDNNADVFVLGKGSNVLISDSGWRGLVIDMSDNWNTIQWNGVQATCQSGALLHAVIKEATDNGFCGLEKCAGIPGSIGGAVVMNAGAFGQSVSDCLDKVEYIDRATLEIKTRDAKDIHASYRSTMFKTTDSLILSARFLFKTDVENKALSSFTEVIAKRKARHPLDMPNCGSVFKNPAGTTAGTVIESCGLKGTIRGGAQVSQKHANFIVNTGTATAADVRSLIVFVQKTVFETKGILLEPEVVFIGTFDNPLFTKC